MLYVSGIAANKGVHILIDALRQVEGNICLYIAGNLLTRSPYASKLHQMADQHVTFIRELNRHNVWYNITNADIVAMPSCWDEKFCFVAHSSWDACASLRDGRAARGKWLSFAAR